MHAVSLLWASLTAIAAVTDSPCSLYGGDLIDGGNDTTYECHSGFCSTDSGPLAVNHAHQNCGQPLDEPSLGGCGDAQGCFKAAAAACNANPKCHSFGLSPVWGLGRAKLFMNSGDGLVPNSDWTVFAATNKTAPPTPAPLPPGSCATDLDCSLNGVCDQSTHKCACDKPWSGDSCETMNFKPVTFPQGYGMAPNTTSWGGGVIYEPSTKEHHIFVSRMTNDCKLNTWTHNSRIDHAVSTSGPAGPYVFRDVAVNTWAHNSAPIQLHDGSYAIVHIGTGEGGPNGGQNCTAPSAGREEARALSRLPERQLSPSRLAQDAATAASPDGGSTIHVSKSLNGPWEPLQNDLGGCNNPAPWVLANGTILIGCSGHLRRAEDISGPYTTVASFPTSGGPAGSYEDPQIYTDKRGNFHCLYHVYAHESPTACINSTVSAHAFSTDGSTWHMSKTPPYGTQVQLTTGETVTVATRERPKPFFDENGVMTHLLNGVCGAANCTDHVIGCVDCKYAHWDYTLVQPLDV